MHTPWRSSSRWRSTTAVGSPSNFSHTAYHRGVLVVPKEPGAYSI